jgi:hypothetical protein
MSTEQSPCVNPAEPFWRCVLDEYSDDDDDDDIEERDTVQEAKRGSKRRQIHHWRSRKQCGYVHESEDDTESRESCDSFEESISYERVPKTPRSTPPKKLTTCMKKQGQIKVAKLQVSFSDEELDAAGALLRPRASFTDEKQVEKEKEIKPRRGENSNSKKYKAWLNQYGEGNVLTGNRREPPSLVHNEAERELPPSCSTYDDDVAVELWLQSTNSYLADKAYTAFEKDAVKRTAPDNFCQEEHVTSAACNNVDKVGKATTTDETAKTLGSTVEDLQCQKDEAEDARWLNDFSQDESIITVKRRGSKFPVDFEQELGENYSSDDEAVELVLQNQNKCSLATRLELLRLQKGQTILEYVEYPAEVQKTEVQRKGTESSANGLCTTGEVAAHLTPLTVSRTTMRARTKNAIIQRKNQVVSSLFGRRNGIRSCPPTQE